MAVAKVVAFLKHFWDKEPLLAFACTVGAVAWTFPFISPYTKYTGMINAATPYTYPVPVRDDGNMPDVPAHPCEPKGRSLEWLKNF
ncbi:NADH dehydrogenase [ubiquinone] 1 alpha subcomplex subunit 3 [Austrofundulus limnaeus]|uniref:NADH dehydrogenase [ubiquinone] 1 alpha subcomplex subunit 3 n=1 Tax=Austrofundulus limnaeus TaxID=52670 RepID=A0A2I4BK95_AUSLI|nr:PREDICTED: NADH dehydrogenase [ubiquinone] 1 alpha subcomplex subunit 3 [Austrofundulus limnaeus]